ncbi:MAG TPA: PstS family phosphate ABC transporter substrate-binding protein, partial [Thermoanaerobaculia bacterium]|nr:PstS family phosphate ABC transporter substrate-binding protein [Thermoanaerobaculia bacterium]
RNRLSAGIVSVTLVAMFAACGGGERRGEGADSAAQDSKPVTVKGSDTMVILGQRLAEEYMKLNPGLYVQVTGGGSGTGIAALINGTTDIAQSSRAISADEMSKAEKARGGVTETPIALDSLAVFVNDRNPIRELTIAQVRDVYTGKTKNWRELGGPNATIVIYGRESSSGTYDYFKEHVLNKADFASMTQTLQGTAAIINAVAKDPNGIGYGGIAYAKDVRAVGMKTEANVPAVAPSEATVADGSYPLSRKLFFYYPSGTPQRVTNFVQWTLTPEAQALVARVGYFPLRTQSGEGDTAQPAATPQ